MNFLHPPITNYPKGTLIGFEPKEFFLIAFLDVLKVHAPGMHFGPKNHVHYLPHHQPKLLI